VEPTQRAQVVRLSEEEARRKEAAEQQERPLRREQQAQARQPDRRLANLANEWSQSVWVAD
jgi:hypothetical protein